MSVTVEDLLTLPSLRNAEVLAGKNGLNKIVSSISVLESINPAILHNDYNFNNDEYLGSEIVITGFLNATDNIELQIQNIRALAMGGEAGLILYYVGIFIKEIDRRLLAVADEMDFPLICMPKNQMNLRYAEVISDVMGAIVKDQTEETSMTISMLEQIARLPAHQQTVENMIRSLSIRLKASVILTDEKLQVLHEANWPGELNHLHLALQNLELPDSLGAPVKFPGISKGLLYRVTIDHLEAAEMELFIIRDGFRLTFNELQQAAESVRMAVVLWNPHQGYAIIPELVRAILKDEPIKMRYLASQLHIDIAAVKNMFIFSGSKFKKNQSEQISEFASKISSIAFADIFDDDLILFTSDFGKMKDIDIFLENLKTLMGSDVATTVYMNLADTIAVRKAYLQHKMYLNDAKKIMPCRNYYTGSDMEFAEQCRSLVANGEAAVISLLSVFAILDNKRDRADLEKTLEVYLLDADQNVQRTSEYLFVHKNTIKYRLKCMSDAFGFLVGRMPESNQLYTAAAIKRLLA